MDSLPLKRGGRFLRVGKPDWSDPLDLSYNRNSGGRWNPPNNFGALYLNGDKATASANARRFFADNGGFSIHDLKPESRPIAVVCEVAPLELTDALTVDGLRALGLSDSYPWKVGWDSCQPIGKAAREAGSLGVVARSAAECDGPGKSVGEELALFEPLQGVVEIERSVFEDWYRERLTAAPPPLPHPSGL